MGYDNMKVAMIALFAALAALSYTEALPSAAMRPALFFAEQRAGRVGYIGWPPRGCKTDTDCKGVTGSYCMNDKTKTAPYFCHEPEVFIAQGLAKPVGVAVDSTTQQVFYDEDDQSSGDTYWPLSGINVDGTNKHQVIPKLLDPQGLEADTANKLVYYAEHHGQRVGVVGYDGKNQKVIHQFGGNDYPTDIRVDNKANKLFVLVQGLLSTGHKLIVMDIDGSNMKVLKSDIVRSYGLTLDTTTQTVYYINGGHGGFIGSLKYDGSDFKTVLGGLDWPYMLDFDGKQLVFSTTGVGDGVIRTCTTAGLNVTQTLTLGFAPIGVKFGQVPFKPSA